MEALGRLGLFTQVPADNTIRHQDLIRQRPLLVPNNCRPECLLERPEQSMHMQYSTRVGTNVLGSDEQIYRQQVIQLIVSLSWNAATE
jgi:hypothetical protein